MSRVQIPPNLKLPLQTPISSTNTVPVVPQSVDSQFKHTPTRLELLRKRLNLKPDGEYLRTSQTPQEISIDSCIFLLNELSLGLVALEDTITGLGKLSLQVNEITVMID
jgi:hypothetical protein